jgi:hypothetical protein
MSIDPPCRSGRRKASDAAGVPRLRPRAYQVRPTSVTTRCRCSARLHRPDHLVPDPGETATVRVVGAVASLSRPTPLMMVIGGKAGRPGRRPPVRRRVGGATATPVRRIRATVTACSDGHVRRGWSATRTTAGSGPPSPPWASPAGRRNGAAPRRPSPPPSASTGTWKPCTTSATPP